MRDPRKVNGSLILSPPGPDGRFAAWAVEGDRARPLIASERLGVAAAAGEAYARERGQAWASDPGRAWRKQAASAGQRRCLRSIGVPTPADLRKGEASNIISLHIGRRAVERAMRFGARPDRWEAAA
jgi:hypothetical protein